MMTKLMKQAGIKMKKIKVFNAPQRKSMRLEEFEDKIEEVKKKLLDTTKEKALLKLEKDKLQKKAFTHQATIKASEDKV